MVSCSVHGTGEIDNKTEPTSYTVTVASGIEHGSVTANPTSAAAGTEIVLTVTPETGYKLKTLTVTKAAGGEVTATPDNGTQPKYKFTMPESNVTVNATFEVSSGGITPTSYTVTVASGIEHGSVTANPTSAAAGTEIVLTVTPETGYQLKTITVTKAAGGEVTTTPDNNTPTKYKFTMPESNVNVSAVFEHASKNIPLTLEAIEVGSITIKNPWSTLKFTKNGGELEQCAGAEHEILVAAGDKICFYAESSGNSANYGNSNMEISCTADCYVYGNIMSLVTLETGATSASQWNPEETTLTTAYTFKRLFWQNSHIKNHAAKTLYLPATTLTARCYESMFYQCTALTTAPKLPATTLTDFCYASMFKKCTALTTAPELPAATLTESCYSNMFTECTSLSYIKCLATDISAESCTTIWVRDVASSGTFVRPASTTGWRTGEHGIPSGWTTEDAQ